MLSTYPACFFKEQTGYSVVFPDLNWLSTCGETATNAMEAAVDCLAGYLYTSQLENCETPSPSSMNDINPENIAKELDIPFEGAFINMVSVDVTAYAKTHFEKSVKKTLTIPAWLNQLAIEKNINFSQVLQEALIAKLQIH
ncbi:MAG: type II toxin-antitoxin system HicB family antitoxin [Lachnospiraceae bacterium]|nr:type II toxin-antitoxin system HicB family antitoxin [Lachnospiraceae bacterium]